MKSKSNIAIIHACKKGYVVDKNGNIFYKKRLRKLKKDKRYGYFTFTVWCANEIITISAHRFIGYYKFGNKIFDEKLEIRHLNGNLSDNSWDNIGIGTTKENNMDILPHVRMRTSINAAVHHRKFTDLEVEEIRNYYNNSKSYKQTMDEYNITSKGTMSYIINNEYKSKK